MNTMEIVALSNKEVDRLVAEKVMGWKVEGDIVIMSDGDYTFLVPDLGGYWTPSQNMNDTWQVWETLEARGYFLSLTLQNSMFSTIKKEWRANITDLTDGSQALGDTAMRAICICALLRYLPEV